MNSIKNRVETLEESISDTGGNPIQTLAERLREARLRWRERKLKDLPEPPRETDQEIKTRSRLLRERLSKSKNG